MQAFNYWNKILSLALYFFCFCPFIFPFVGFSTDIQPYALLISAFIIVVNIKNLCINNGLKILGLYACFSILIAGITNADVFIVLKCIYSYISLFCIAFILYNIFIWSGGLNERFSKKLIILWLVVGLIQVFIYSNFGKQFVSGGRTTLDRGVLGLASEPSFYGIQCFYFLFVAYSFKIYSVRYMLISSFMAFALAQSFTGMMFLLAFLIPFTIDYIKFEKISSKHLFYIFLVGVILIFIFKDFLLEKRIGFLVDLLIDSNTSIVFEDESAGVRFRTILDALYLSFDNSFFPMGYTKRVGSMFGGILQEFGFLGVPLMIYMVYILSSFFSSVEARITAGLLFFIVFFSTIQLSNPMIAFVLALGFYKKRIVC